MLHTCQRFCRSGAQHCQCPAAGRCWTQQCCATLPHYHQPPPDHFNIQTETEKSNCSRPPPRTCPPVGVLQLWCAGDGWPLLSRHRLGAVKQPHKAATLLNSVRTHLGSRTREKIRGRRRGGGRHKSVGGRWQRLVADRSSHNAACTAGKSSRAGIILAVSVCRKTASRTSTAIQEKCRATGTDIAGYAAFFLRGNVHPARQYSFDNAIVSRVRVLHAAGVHPTATTHQGALGP